MSRVKQGIWLAGAVVVLGLAGCGTPGAPQPPSLNLPATVRDLEAVRAGHAVTLRWTMPRRTTDKLLLTTPIEVRICRAEQVGACQFVGPVLHLMPAAAGTWSESLPAELTAGAARVVRYAVELPNASGRSAGLSNRAVILAGAAPAPVAGLTSELRKDGVVLHWAANGEDAAVRLHRRLLTAVAAAPKKSALGSEKEPVEMTLLVAHGSQTGGGVDASATVGETYEYRAQRVAQVEVDGKMLELAGELTEPLRVVVGDIFPPDAPVGLVAVASQAGDGTVSIDLSWEPNAEADLAGYIVYRSEGQGAWQRISPAGPVVGPAFHDAAVAAGRRYAYAVTAVDRSGHESARSAAAEETTPE